MAEVLDILMFVTVCALLMLGFPVAFTLAGVALIFATIGGMLGVFNLAQLNFFPQRMFGIMSNEVVVAAPLFIFMGLMLERSKVAEDLLTSMASLFRGMPGGLLFSVIVVGALMAASTGIVGATVVTMGLLSLPVMMRHGYDPRPATGAICAAGTLGQVIPPSIVLVFLGDILTYANQQANLSSGNLTGKSVGVGELFAGSLLPGLMLVGLYLAHALIVSRARPERVPPLPPDALVSEIPRLRLLARVLFAPVMLMFAVLGSILGGVATPTEAAGVGAIGAVLLAAARKKPAWTMLFVAGVAAAVALIVLNQVFDLRLNRDVVAPFDQAATYVSFALAACLLLTCLVAVLVTFADRTLNDAVYRTARITAMVFAVLIGASLFSLTFRGFGGEETVHGFLEALPGGLFGAMAFTMVLMFVMGFFLDFLEIIFIIVPLVCPTLIVMGADPVWLGVMIAVNLQTSFLTPPFGFALFFLRGVAPPEVPTQAMYRGVVPFIVIQVIALAMLAAFPQIGTWLPFYLYGS